VRLRTHRTIAETAIALFLQRGYDHVSITEVVAFYRLIVNTPALASALSRYQTRSEEALAAALQEATPADDPQPERVARLAAAQIIAICNTLGRANQERIAAGQTADAIAPDALAEADRAHQLLRSGLQPYRS
jgi:hypothetical protein